MEVECQYETFNGLPVYYGGDLCDSKEYDTLNLAPAAYAEDDNFDAPEGMDLMTYTHSRPDGGETRGVDTVDMVYMCRTVSWVHLGRRKNPTEHRKWTLLILRN